MLEYTSRWLTLLRKGRKGVQLSHYTAFMILEEFFILVYDG